MRTKFSRVSGASGITGYTMCYGYFFVHLYWSGRGFNDNTVEYYVLLAGVLRVTIAYFHVLCTYGKVMSRPPGSRLGVAASHFTC